ncbi:hypothetical protein BDQ17DRAFT_1433640 [Cyathus striatus]|nr:hypothetical protein BDQ17DRAFT_1433640 [Cyathus striatus]
MASMIPSLQLCLIHNDPMSTLLVTPDGEAMYSIETPGLRSPFALSPSSTPSSSQPDIRTPRSPVLSHSHLRHSPVLSHSHLSPQLALPERSSTYPPVTSRTAPIRPTRARTRSISLPHKFSPRHLASSAQEGLNEHSISNLAGIMTSLSLAPRDSSPFHTQTHTQGLDEEEGERISTVMRLERMHAFGHGHVTTEIGVVRYHPAHGARILVLRPIRFGALEMFELVLPPTPLPCVLEDLKEERSGDGVVSKSGQGDGESERAAEVWQENEWEFTGPDNKQYKWQMFVQCPMLLLTYPSDQQPTPLARYRKAKLGIISRSCRASLDVFPAGMGIMDMVVVSFVGFMRRIVG